MMVFKNVLTACIIVTTATKACSGQLNSGQTGPLDVTLYYESMCPYCRHFITTQLYPTYKEVTSSVLKLTMIPYGWAHQRWHNNDWQFACQHGHKECVGNQIHTCVLNITSNDPDLYLPFIACMETNTEHDEELSAMTKCAKSSSISKAEVITCINSAEGRELQHQMGLLTEGENIKFTPWIVIGDQKGGAIYQKAYTNFLKLVCEMYTGPTPTVCGKTSASPVVG